MPGGRPKKNREFFDDKRDEMYDLYITQNKTLDEVRDHYEQQGVSASIRAYQARFREWQFPSKRVHYDDVPDIHVRVKELWGKNYNQKQMLEVLLKEGYNVNDRQLSTVRRKDGLKMRDGRSGVGESSEGKRKRSEGGAEGEARVDDGEEDGVEPEEPTPQPQTVPLQVQIKRQERQAKLWAESAERLQNRTRRRRTKGWAGLPPDIGLPPRFPSELTLEEGRNLLRLDAKLYKEIRDTFEETCNTNQVDRKSSCAPGLWPWVKEELINRSQHLQTIFRSPQAAFFDSSREPMALDLICMDVTKKIRTSGKYLSLSDAKNLLGLTPDDSRDVRKTFFDILKADYFTIKLDTTKAHWESLKQKWIDASPRLQREFQNTTNSDVWNMKHKALEAIARDVQKRNRDQQIQKDSTKAAKKTTTRKLSPKKSKKKDPSQLARAPPKKNEVTHGPEHRTESGRPPWMPATPPPHPSPPLQNASGIQAPEARVVPLPSSHPPSYQDADMQIDPSLLEAAAMPTNQPFPDLASPPPLTMGPSMSATSIYIRPSLLSLQKYPVIPKLWLDTLAPPYTLPSLRAVMGKKLTGMYRIVKIEGLADGAAVDNNVGSKWSIDEDEELDAYLGYQRERGGKASFVVELA